MTPRSRSIEFAPRGCSIFGGLSLAKPAGLSGVVDVHAIKLSWQGVAGASSYNVYFTKDGSAPTKASPAVTDLVDTTYTDLNLDPGTAYRFAVAGVADGGTGPLSDPTPPTQPLALLTISGAFGSYANAPAGVVVVSASSATGIANSAPVASEAIATTDSSGNATFMFYVTPGTFVGWSLFEDTNGDGQLSTGDTVWNNSAAAGTFTYLYPASAVEADITRSYSPWAGANGAPAAASY